MRFFRLLTIILLVPYFCHAQQIGKYIEVIEKDSLKIYYKLGKPVDKECAEYYRIARMDPHSFVFSGASEDYHITGEIAVKSVYLNNRHNGPYAAYYINGQIKEQGAFLDGKKTGEWRYWYENGQLHKVIIFDAASEGYYFQELYQNNGKQLIQDGNGNFEDDSFLRGTTIKGKIKNGRKDGEWTLYNEAAKAKTGVEIFEDGRFIEGRNISKIAALNTMYYEKPISNFDKFEDLLYDYTKLSDDCQGLVKRSEFNPALRYNKYAKKIFFDFVNRYFKAPMVQNGYILIGMELEPKGKIVRLDSYSTINDAAVEEELKKVLLLSERLTGEKEHNTLRQEKIFFIFQFSGGDYTILNAPRR